MAKLRTLQDVENVIAEYQALGGYISTIEDGVLGYGLTICYGWDLKTTIIQEVYVNCWTSAHKIRTYNEMPKKYADMLDEYFEC